MPLPVTSLYGGLLAIMLLVLSARVIARRRSGRVSLGFEGAPDLERAVRAHGNFVEYVPLALVLMALAEVASYPHWLLHGLGVALLLGRLAHATALVRVPQDLSLRVAGVTLTFSVLGVLAVLVLIIGLAPRSP